MTNSQSSVSFIRTACRKSSPRSQRLRRETSGPGVEVISLGNARRATRRGLVPRNCRLAIAGHLEQVGADRVQTIVTRETLVGVERFEQLQTSHRSMHHRGSDGVI